MSSNIMISGQTLTGKTMIAIALASKLKAQGIRVGYFKPVGRKSFELSTETEDVDEDAYVMKHLLGMKENVGTICPIARSKATYDELLRLGPGTLMAKVKECYGELVSNYDSIIFEGTMVPWNLLHVDLSTPQIAKELNASVLCLVNFTSVEAIDEVYLMRDLFKQHGIENIAFILSQVPPMLKSIVEDRVTPFLKKQGIRVCGIIDARRELYSPTVGEILKALEGQMVLGEDKLGILVDQFMVGSMAPENALKYFRRAADKAVITSGDRTDICLAALETDTNLLILTGGMGPDIRTISRAKELGVPIMMTAYDTFSTGHIVDNLVGTVTSDNEAKLAIIDQIVNESLDFDCLLN